MCAGYLSSFKKSTYSYLFVAVLTINRHLCGLNRADIHKASFKSVPPLSLDPIHSKPFSVPSLPLVSFAFQARLLLCRHFPHPLSMAEGCSPLPGVASAAPLGHSYSPLWHGGCGGSPSPVSTCFSLRSGSYSPLPGWWQW